MVKPKKAKVYFFSNDISPNLRNIKKLKVFIETIFKNEGKRLGSINYIFSTDRYLLRINKGYLKHNYFTDIITFDLSDSPDPIIGEVFISVDRVRDNAKSYGVTIKSEIHRVIFHGALHLCGYRDKTAIQISKMRQKENKYLQRYFK